MLITCRCQDDNRRTSWRPWRESRDVSSFAQQWRSPWVDRFCLLSWVTTAARQLTRLVQQDFTILCEMERYLCMVPVWELKWLGCNTTESRNLVGSRIYHMSCDRKLLWIAEIFSRDPPIYRSRSEYVHSIQRNCSHMRLCWTYARFRGQGPNSAAEHAENHLLSTKHSPVCYRKDFWSVTSSNMWRAQSVTHRSTRPARKQLFVSIYFLLLVRTRVDFFASQ